MLSPLSGKIISIIESGSDRAAVVQEQRGTESGRTPKGFLRAGLAFLLYKRGLCHAPSICLHSFLKTDSLETKRFYCIGIGLFLLYSVYLDVSCLTNQLSPSYFIKNLNPLVIQGWLLCNVLRFIFSGVCVCLCPRSHILNA